jgi:hypothetical protein
LTVAVPESMTNASRPGAPSVTSTLPAGTDDGVELRAMSWSSFLEHAENSSFWLRCWM